MRPTLALFFVAALGGCAHTHDVRYVYQDRDFGVIGMPENTDCWPTHYRRQGAKLMDRALPRWARNRAGRGGHRGRRTLKVEGSSSAEVAPQISASLLKVVKLGHSASRSEAETVKVKECRIIYRRACSAKPKDYAGAATLTPTLYVDPNAAECRKATQPPQEKPIPPGAHKADANASKPAQKPDKIG